MPIMTDQGLCRANLHKWGLTASELCGQQQNSLVVWRDSMRLMMTQSTGWKPCQQQHSPNEGTNTIIDKPCTILFCQAYNCFFECTIHHSILPTVKVASSLWPNIILSPHVSIYIMLAAANWNNHQSQISVLFREINLWTCLQEIHVKYPPLASTWASKSCQPWILQPIISLPRLIFGSLTQYKFSQTLKLIMYTTWLVSYCLVHLQHSHHKFSPMLDNIHLILDMSVHHRFCLQSYHPSHLTPLTVGFQLICSINPFFHFRHNSHLLNRSQTRLPSHELYFLTFIFC